MPGDLVLRKVLGTAKNLKWGKLGPNWEGSYRITLVAGIGAYYLEDLDELLLMKAFFVTFLFIPLSVEFPIIIILDIKQNLDHSWPLRPHTLGKLICYNNFPKY